MAQPWQCPACSGWATIENAKNFEIFWNRTDIDNELGQPLVFVTEAIFCPNPGCKKLQLSLSLNGIKYPAAVYGTASYDQPGGQFRQWNLIPSSRAKSMPAFVPAQIVADYEEACAIETLSPKASATISRRCVQQIIRGFFGVSRTRLFDEIQEIKALLPLTVWEAVDDLREIGNIGAHSEKDINIIVDIEPEEAAALIRLVEILITETYIAQDRRNQELADVKAIAAAKKLAKAAPATTP